MVVLKGKKISLRFHRKTDVEDLYRHLNDYDIAKWFQGFKWPITRKKVVDFIDYAVALSRKKRPKAIRFAIILNSTKEIVGCTNLHGIDYDKKAGETGTWIGREYWGQGINKEAKLLLLDYGFNKIKLEKVKISHADNNKRSMRAVAKLGIHKEGILRENKRIGGKYYDVHKYSILKKEWPEVRKRLC